MKIKQKDSVIKKLFGKKYLNREKLLDKIKYLDSNRDKREEFSSIDEFIIYELKIIKESLLSDEGIEQKYIPCARAKHCIEEFAYYLNNNKLEACFYDIYEVIESDKNEIYLDRFDTEYKYSVNISNEEKSIILDMVNKLEAKILNN